MRDGSGVCAINTQDHPEFSARQVVVGAWVCGFDDLNIAAEFGKAACNLFQKLLQCSLVPLVVIFFARLICEPRIDLSSRCEGHCAFARRRGLD